MFEITEQQIRDEVEKGITYQQGFMYYLSGRVKNFSWDEDELLVQAKVKGTETYDVEVEFFSDGDIAGGFCTCPAYENYAGMCKHLVAVLKKAQEKFGQFNAEVSRTKIVTDNLFDVFDNAIAEGTPKTLKMEITYEFQKVNHYSSTAFSSLSLKIGEDRLYVVKSVKKFLEAITEGKTIEFGKSFVFEPKRYEFSVFDKAIIDILMELYETEKVACNIAYDTHNAFSIFKGKSVYLSGTSLKRIFRVLKDQKFKVNVLGKESSDTMILQNDLPLTFKLSKKDNDLLFKWEENNSVIPLTDDGSYFFYDGNIYEPSLKQRKYFSLLYNALAQTRRKMLFSGLQKERFVSEILPYLKSIAQIDVDRKVEEQFYETELQAEVYLDRTGDKVTAEIFFVYGEEKLSAFGMQKLSAPQGRILIREVEKEKKIIGLFEQADFKVNGEKAFLQDEAKIFEFVYHTLSELQKEAAVYYSDSFKSMKIRDARSFSAGVRLNEKSNMLEFSFQYDGIDQSELKHIFAALRERKKYHRLKNGSFLALDAAELTQVSDMMEYLDLSGKDLDAKIIELPKYRAMYIDSHLREGKLKHFERNLPFKQLVQNIREPEDMEFTVPESLNDVLRDYQKVGFKWLMTLAAYGFGGVLADDMGLGKTLQAIAFIMAQKGSNLGPALVVAPTSLIYNWQNEVEKFASDLKVLVIAGMPKERQEQIQEIQNVDIVVTSYPLIRRDIELYQDFQFAYCFLDEAQHIKNPESINAKSVKQIKAGAYFALTGTPIENSLTELWSIFDFVMPGYLLSNTKFMKKYERPIVKNHDEKALAELGKQLRPFILRRMKRDVLKELPEKIEGKMVAQLTDEQKKIYLAYLQEAKGEISKEIEMNGFQKSQIKILAILTRLRQICCHPGLFVENYQGESGKMQLLQEIISDAIESGHRILLFSQFTSMLAIIKAYLDKEKLAYYYLEGSTKAEQRNEMVKAFNAGKRQLFLISLKAGGTGLNLTGADMVIHFDPWWNPAVEDQATDRAYRIGQENVVQVIKLITQGTIEEKIFALQQKKKEMIEAVIQPGETLLTKMTEAEIRGLFDL